MKKLTSALFLPLFLLANTNQIPKDLDYLFDNAKFPVDDYLLKAGLAQPKSTTIDISDENNTNQQTQANNEKAQETQEQAAEPEQTKIEKIQEKLEYNENKAQANQQPTKQNKANKVNKLPLNYQNLIRENILASRAAEIKNLSDDNKFGVNGFTNQQSIDISTNEHKLFRTIRAGRLIPALLTTAISSDLSGIITAIIEQDIYATMGEAVLIPRGSKAIGFYQNNAKIGQNRLEIFWREIITPQGVNIMLTNAISADNMGMSGAVGVVNNKYFDRYALPTAISTVSNALLLGIAQKINKNSSATTQYQEQIYSGAQNDINAIVQDIIAQHNQIKATIEIRSGSRIFLVPTNHMWFAKPKNNEVLLRYFKN